MPLLFLESSCLESLQQSVKRPVSLVILGCVQLSMCEYVGTGMCVPACTCLLVLGYGYGNSNATDLETLGIQWATSELRGTLLGILFLDFHIMVCAGVVVAHDKFGPQSFDLYCHQCDSETHVD